MKKEFLALAVSLLTAGSLSPVFAKAAGTWTLIQENKAGAYYADPGSIKAEPGKTAAPQVYTVRTKAVFRDVPFIRLLNEHYGKKLKKGDSADHCELTVSLNPSEGTYRVDRIELYSRSSRLLERKKLKEPFVPIPKGTYMTVLAKQLAAKDETQTPEQPSGTAAVAGTAGKAAVDAAKKNG